MAGYWYVSGSATIGIWRYDNAVGWIKVTTRDLYFYNTYGSNPGNATLFWDQTWDIEIPAPFHYLGISVDSVEGNTAAINDIVSMIYTTTAASGERSATPGGEQVRATVRPI